MVDVELEAALAEPAARRRYGPPPKLHIVGGLYEPTPMFSAFEGMEDGIEKCSFGSPRQKRHYQNHPRAKLTQAGGSRGVFKEPARPRPPMAVPLLEGARYIQWANSPNRRKP